MRTQKALFLSIAAMFMIVAAQGAFAHDFWDIWTGKPWQRGDPGSTHQEWEFTESGGPAPTYSANPYGTAQLLVQNGQYPDVVPGPDYIPGTTEPQIIPTWHLGTIDATGQETPGAIDLRIPNNPFNNPVKLIYVQITSDKNTLNNAEPTTTPGAYGITHPGPIIKHGSTSWYTYNWLIEIRPNPEFESLTFIFPYSTNISQIVVDTICTVPEPSSLASLGASGLLTGLLALRRRRR